ncbi:MAG: alpha/beta fold hydrolase [Gammaproteobacteria bacterium]|nr:alpha/beta fold hydrolase [Gammaproteobacteria bacterium]MDH3465471.1 alpha/beta fold hydrolase [Gammaproteobacteria bacterium]
MATPARQRRSMRARFEDRLFQWAINAARRSAGFVTRRIGGGPDRIVYLERPGEAEPIVLLHGFAANKDNWLQFVRGLPRHYRIISFDLPGHGDSGFSADYDYRPTVLAQRIVAAVDILGLDRFHIAGNSLGGWVSTLIAADGPGRILSLGLIDAAGVFPPIQSDLQRMLEDGQNPLLVSDRAGFDVLMDMVFYRRPPMPWPIPQALTRMAQNHYERNTKIFDDMYSNLVETIDLLPDLDMPTLVIWGAKDRILHVSSTEIFDAHLPHSEVIVMPNCGHCPILERAREAVFHYRSWLEATGV